MKFKVTELTRDDIVTILSDGLFGSDWLDADYNREDWEKIPEGERCGECFEDKLADIILHGGKITLTDYTAEDETYGEKGHLDEDGNGVYEISYQDFLDACSVDMGDAMDLYNENDDYFTGNNILQCAMFGEIVYG